MSTWVAMGFTFRQSYGCCVTPDGTFYTNSTSSGGGGRLSGVHRGSNMTDPVYVFPMPSPVSMCNGSGNDVYANNYNGAGIYKSINGGAFSAVPSSGSYPGNGIAYNPLTDTLYQSGRLGGAGATSVFKSVASGAWTDILGRQSISSGLCVNNAIDGSVFASTNLGTYKQSAGLGSFTQASANGANQNLASSPAGNIYYYGPANLYRMIGGVGDYTLVAGITNPGAPGSATMSLAFDRLGNLYATSQTVQDVYTIYLPEEDIRPSAPIILAEGSRLQNIISWIHS